MKRGAEWSALTVRQAALDPREDDFIYYVSGLPNSPPDFRLMPSKIECRSGP